VCNEKGTKEVYKAWAKKRFFCSPSLFIISFCLPKRLSDVKRGKKREEERHEKVRG
jgi:hypothetical protein